MRIRPGNPYRGLKRLGPKDFFIVPNNCPVLFETGIKVSLIDPRTSTIILENESFCAVIHSKKLPYKQTPGQVQISVCELGKEKNRVVLFRSP